MSSLQERYDGLLDRVSCIYGVVGTVRLAERDGFECLDDLLRMLEEYCAATVSDYSGITPEAVDVTHGGAA